MAITWDVKFTKKPDGHYSAVFQRFDDVEPEKILNTVNIGDAILETLEQEKALWDFVYSRYEKEAAHISANSARITELQDTGKIAIVAKEAKEIS